MYKLVSVILILNVAAILGDFPDSITRCHRGDFTCYKKITQEVFKTHSGGLPELNLLPFDPLHVKSLILKKNPSSPVNIELKFKDIDVIGLKTSQLKSTKGLNFGERSVLEAVVPELLLKGNYSIDGRVLILPIVGKGTTMINLKNLHFKYAFDFKSVEKNGEIFAQIEHVKLELKPERVQYQLDNLFNGDKALGDNMNKFLNENWSDIFNEIEPRFSKGLSLIIKQLINNVVSKYPYNVLFPEPV